MPSLKDIRKRIGSVKNTQKITSAMKMVSAAKLRRAQEAAESARPYALKMHQVISGLVSRVDPSKHPLLQSTDEVEKALLIVITSNRGLCGGYNANVFRTVERFVRDRPEIDFHLATVGRKGRAYFRDAKITQWKDYPEIIGNVSYASAKRLAKEATAAFVDGEFDRVFVVYNEFISAISYNTIVHPLLPLELEDLEGDDEESADSVGEYIFEPDEEELLKTLLPAHIEVQVLRALLEAEASEHGARMTAMDNATNNAKEMIDSLTLQYNRARQAYITKELVEIVSGAEALEG